MLSHPTQLPQQHALQTHTRTHTHTHTHAHTHTHTHTHTHMHTHTHTYAYVHTHARTHTHTHMYTHTYIYIQFWIILGNAQKLLTQSRDGSTTLVRVLSIYERGTHSIRAHYYAVQFYTREANKLAHRVTILYVNTSTALAFRGITEDPSLN